MELEYPDMSLVLQSQDEGKRRLVLESRDEGNVVVTPSAYIPRNRFPERKVVVTSSAYVAATL